ncbi:MAG: S8 family serine peptidase [Actinobacteria bacterium]|nr:S8 family serine peptidase [Actinomycetota bacterium]
MPLVIAIGLVFGTAAATADESKAEPSRFAAIGPAADSDGPATTIFRPGALEGDREVRVIVQISGTSVGAEMADARAEGRTLTRAQRRSIRASLKARQQPVEETIRDLGGEVLGSYQDAYNGLSAVIPAGELGALADTPGVVRVHPVRIFEADNTPGAQYVEAPSTWQSLGRTGKGIKLGIIDTGIDYTHANFGGSGSEAQYKANDRKILEQGSFPAGKVEGGWDFVGDEYEAAPTDEEEFGNALITEARPDADPLDCNGHGSHVAGSAAGYGVLPGGTTYRGPYNAGVYTTTNFLIGPGTAPEARLYAYKIFGCSGSTTEDVLVAAFNRALADGMDVVNVSVGSPFGRTDEPSAVAANTIAEAGVVYVGSAGNSGTSAYDTGAPAAANRALSVSALDGSRATFPGASFALSTAQTFAAQNSNGAPFTDGTQLQVKVLRKPDGTVSLGCNPAEYVDVAGKLVVTLRGTCARVARAVFGDKAGAAAVAMINTAAAYPGFEGEITGNPDTGEQYLVDIPFFGVRGVLGPSPFEDADLLLAADGGTVTLTSATVANPGYQRFSTFTAGGPRNVDSAAKPDVTAPGQSVLSTDYGTGFKAATLSGTSMAAPMTAGVAALVNEAHPTWSTERIKAAIMNTADASAAKILGYDPRRAGAGVVDARKAADTVGLALAGQGESALSFGYEPLAGAYSETLQMRLENTGSSPISYTLSSATVGDPLGASIAVAPGSVTVPANSTVPVDVTMSLSAAAVAALPAAALSNFGGLRHIVRGVVIATPTTTGAGIYPLRVPFALVPRGLSNVTAGALTPYATAATEFITTLPVSNTGIHSGTADVFAWGIEDASEDVASGRQRTGRGNRGVGQPEDSVDIRAAGVQILPREALCGTAAVGACGKADDRSIVFAVNMSGFWSNPSTTKVDVAIDLQNDGRPEFFVVGVDVGAALSGSSDGRFASLVYDAKGKLVNSWAAEAPMNGSTMLLPTLASDIGLSLNEASTAFTYSIAALALDYSPGEAVLVDTTESANFRVNEPPVSSGQFLTLAPGETKTLNLAVNRARVAGSDVLGWMIVSHDDANGRAQADLIPLPDVRGK